jgi:hypothetical protein
LVVQAESRGEVQLPMANRKARIYAHIQGQVNTLAFDGSQIFGETAGLDEVLPLFSSLGYPKKVILVHSYNCLHRTAVRSEEFNIIKRTFYFSSQIHRL